MWANLEDIKIVIVCITATHCSCASRICNHRNNPFLIIAVGLGQSKHHRQQLEN